MNATGEAGTQSVPRELQAWLEQLYSLPPLAPVDAFLLEGRTVGGPTETLLLREDAGDLELGLYLDPALVERLAARGGLAGFATHPLEEFWTVLEGVSHFVCLGWHAERDREISALDLEVQAEIDKFVSAWELGRQSGLGNLAAPLYRELFEGWRGSAASSDALSGRYRFASELAAAYCRYLCRRYDDNSLELRAELRAFFRLPPHRRRERLRALLPTAP